MIQLWHVQWNEGVMLGEFFDDREAAMIFAQDRANLTGRTTEVTEAVLKSCDARSIAALLNDDDHILVWKSDSAMIVVPQEAVDQ